MAQFAAPLFRLYKAGIWDADTVSNTIGVKNPKLAQKRYWLLTIPKNDWQPPTDLADALAYIRGQAERGAGGYEHWQVLAVFKRGVRLAAVKRVFGRTCHAEPSRSDAANEYVWKEDTAVEGTRFELGTKPPQRNSKADWERVWASAIQGALMDIAADIRVRCYHALRRIRADNAQPVGVERSIRVYWGRTGTGKSRQAWDAAGLDAYGKDPNTKFWDGYIGQENVVVDEFRGKIDIAHLLRWCDRYPVRVELKGSAAPLLAKNIWITSNLHPRDWYPDLDQETLAALLRRLDITHFP